MSDSESPEIDVFGTTYKVDEAGKIHPQHTMSPRRAKQLEKYYPGASGLQEAIRWACRDAIDERRQTLTVEHFERQSATVQELAEYSREIIDRLDEIHDAVDN